MAFVGMAMFGTISYVPLFVQGVIGTSATLSGVVLTPLLLGAVTTSFYPLWADGLAHRPLPAELRHRPARPRGWVELLLWRMGVNSNQRPRRPATW